MEIYETMTIDDETGDIFKTAKGEDGEVGLIVIAWGDETCFSMDVQTMKRLVTMLTRVLESMI